MTVPLAHRAQTAATAATWKLPARPRVLAEPPAGSDLHAIRGDAGPPGIGHSLTALNDTLAFAERQRSEFGPISWFGGFGRDIVLVLGPDGIEEVLANRDAAFANREGWGYVIGPFFEGGVMLMDFDEHRHHRRIMQQAFKRDRLVGYLDGINRGIGAGLDRWQPASGFRLYDRAKQLTLDLATEVFVGTTLGPEADALNRSFQAAVVGGAALIRADVPGGKWHRGLRGREALAEFFRRQLPAKRASAGDDLFSVLCHAEGEDGERFTDEEVVRHMIFVLMAAHDTSTATLSHMAYFLGRHPEWQARLREESAALGKPAIGYDDLERLPALDMVMRETLRYFAPVGMLFREALKDTAVQGHHVPAGTLTALGLFPSMRMEPWWSDPHTWDPERFSPERKEDTSHKYAWVPFGGNVHKCIGLHFGGMEVKAIMHQLLARFEWTTVPGYEVPLTFATGPVPADGLPLDLRPLAG